MEMEKCSYTKKLMVERYTRELADTIVLSPMHKGECEKTDIYASYQVEKYRKMSFFVSLTLISHVVHVYWIYTEFLFSKVYCQFVLYSEAMHLPTAFDIGFRI